MMNVSIFGMGYVGCVTAACLLKQGHCVRAVEISRDKIDILRSKRWPIFEKGLDKLVSEKSMSQLLSATNDAVAAVLDTEISIVCVGTPSLTDGNVDTQYVKRTVEEIGEGLEQKSGEHTVLIRSTVPPGTTEGELAPILKAKTDCAVKHLAFYPEFLREGCAISDFFNPSLHLIGCNDSFPKELLGRLLPQAKKAAIATSIRTAEFIKYANNSFHALKIAFSNELALVGKSCGVDMNEVMKMFCEDITLNISPAYLMPGFAFGGSCLPKELRAVIAFANKSGFEAPLFKGILKSNSLLIERVLSLIHGLSPKTVGYFGISFKPETDDIRESPILRVIERQLSKTRSYTNIVRQIVFDNEKTVKKVRGKYGTDFEIASNPNELIRKSDIVVLGPYRINAVLEKELIKSNKFVVDLKWHAVSQDMRTYQHYLSLH